MMSIEYKDDEEQKKSNWSYSLRAQTRTFCGIEKPLKNYVSHVEKLDDLVRELHTVFSSDYVNIERVNHLMMVYASNYNDWKKFGEKIDKALIDCAICKVS